jgi:hypothetical protein
MHRRRHDRSGGGGHALAIMAHAGQVDYRPRTAGLHCRRGRVPGSDIIMRALIAGCTLAWSAGPLGRSVRWLNASAVPAITVLRKPSNARNASVSTSVWPRPNGQGVARSGIA